LPSPFQLDEDPRGYGGQKPLCVEIGFILSKRVVLRKKDPFGGGMSLLQLNGKQTKIKNGSVEKGGFFLDA